MKFLQVFQENWMMVCGILVLVSFFPLTVCSYRKFRLPRKQEQFRKIKKRLLDNHIEDPKTFSVIDEKYRWWDYCLPLAFLTIFSILGFDVLFNRDAELLLSGVRLIEVAREDEYKIGSLVAIGMAFLGAYVWSIQYIFRRLMTIDLPPGAFYSAGIRMVFAVFVSLAFYHFSRALPDKILVIPIPDKTLINMTPVVAFIIGTFPQRALNYMIEYFRFSASKADKQADELPLDMLEGITIFHKVRLSEMGIENVQNLVKASLVELILKTPFAPRQLIDWMAQGRLCLQFRRDTGKLRDAGVRTIMGFKILGDGGKLDQLAASTNLDLHRLEAVYEIIKDGPAIERLQKAKDCLHMI
jgi:hypothetical protein